MPWGTASSFLPLLWTGRNDTWKGEGNTFTVPSYLGGSLLPGMRDSTAQISSTKLINEGLGEKLSDKFAGRRQPLNDSNPTEGY